MNSSLEELALLYVLDQLDAAQRTAFESDLLENKALAAFVDELEAGLARELRSLPQTAPPAELLAAIENDLDRDSPRQSAGPQNSVPAWSPAARRWGTIARWGIAACIAVSLAIIAVQQLHHPVTANTPAVVYVVGLDGHQSTLTSLPLTGDSSDADAGFIQLASLAEKYWEKPADLPAATTGRPSADYAVFDPVSSQGFIAIQQLPAAAPGKCYQLWLVDTATGQVHDAGALPAAASNHGLYFFSVAAAAKNPRDSISFFVTTEDAAAAPPKQPRGQVVLGNRRI